MPPASARRSQPLLSVTGLRVQRGNATLLHDISWRVEKGQHWVILGANGCGKTSLLKTLTGYLSATSGDIELLGARYGEADWRDLRFHIGIVTSAFHPSIPPAEPALETVISGKYAQLDLWAPTTKADEKAARKLLETAGASHLADREWIFLSQGERQRILIARALMAKPRLLILDEPCAGLDPVAREHFLGFMERLAQQKNAPTFVLVTHHVEEITPAFTHALILRAGRVVDDGPITSTLTNENLSTAFGEPVKIAKDHGIWRLLFSQAARHAPKI
ncbi:ABC transporter [Nibricoccus aquaticus]|uniref:ABC transporter n=1 Tax=Nibricoccus aquaticus TaxID=2576891 RepID=A0A290QH14_9BACT|nr:ABC transporter ATP-binding protein [Nibricoccus aquaticus]ATC64638.1 ABC transporter [Nibricoccus aquaticus]